MSKGNCSICKHELSDDPKSVHLDCGGDCRQCMAFIGEDPDCLKAISDLIEHYDSCSPDYPEKLEDEPPRHVIANVMAVGQIIWQCVDCGALLK